ncbi:MAG: substrate-binding domain-containing protein [Burkholderiaceae bacterium]
MHPHLTITVGTAPPQRALELLIDGEVDVIIAPAVYAQSPVGIARVLLAEDEIGVYCGPRHPLAGRTDLTSSDLAQCDWINVGTTSPFQARTRMNCWRKTGCNRSAPGLPPTTMASSCSIFFPSTAIWRCCPVVRLMLLRDRYPFYGPLPHGKSQRDLFVWCRQDIRSSAVIESFILPRARPLSPSTVKALPAPARHGHR